jgi:primary-amine oxidase
MKPLDAVTIDLFNGSVLAGTLAAADEAPMSYDGKWRRSWIQLRRAAPGSWLLGVDFYIYVSSHNNHSPRKSSLCFHTHVQVDFTGTDPNEYKILKLVHDQVVYENITSLLTAWESGNLVRSLPEDTTWATRAIQGKPRDLDDKPGPRSVLFDGARYRVDKEEGWVSWLGWNFYTSFHRDMGLHLWDM